jgi:hypothetical protein
MLAGSSAVNYQSGNAAVFPGKIRLFGHLNA